MSLTFILLGSLGILILFTIFFVTSYNNLIGKKELIANSKSQVAAQLESRFDALKSLIAATKQYTSKEAETLENIVKQRTKLNGDMSAEDNKKAEEIYQSSLSKLIAVSESYPELKSNELYIKSMNSIDEYEKNVRLARMSYNDTVTIYNRLVISIPTNIIASITGFSKEVYFETSEEKRNIPSWD